MPKPDYTHVVIVLDKSSSMLAVQGDTINSFNEYIDEQRKLTNAGDMSLSLIQFNDDAPEWTLKNVPITKVLNLDYETYKPTGGTALFDAIGFAIEETEQWIADTEECNRPDKVLFCIITDGEENSSQKYHIMKGGRERIFKMISGHRSDKQNPWEFVFLGADQDAIAAATPLGIHANNTMSYQNTSAGSSTAIRHMSDSTKMYRSSKSKTTSKFFSS